MRLLIEEMPHVRQGFNLDVKPHYINTERPVHDEIRSSTLTLGILKHLQKGWMTKQEESHMDMYAPIETTRGRHSLPYHKVIRHLR